MPTKKTPAKKPAAKKTAEKKAGLQDLKAIKPIAIIESDKKAVGNAATVTPSEEIMLKSMNAKQTENPDPIKMASLEKKLVDFNIKFKSPLKGLLAAVNKINPNALLPVDKMPDDLKKSMPSMRPEVKRFHGAKISLGWFPFPSFSSPCADKFGYMSPSVIRTATKLPFNAASQLLLGQLGNLMGDLGREVPGDSIIPAGYTYFGQFVDHDITLDVSSTLEADTDANTINNMRSPSLDLDSLYSRGPALDPFMYVFPSGAPSSAVKFQLGTNRNLGPGGPGGPAGPGGMQVQTDFDVPRVHNPLVPPLSSNTAIIGDPRNDENLIVVQFHHAMMRFHNQVVDMLVLAGFSGDIFTEAKKIVTHHYQWAVVKDFLKRICGLPAVNSALATVVAPVGSNFRMPVEFAVAAYRFGHSMIRNNYWVNFNFTNATLDEVFRFNRNPNLPVLSNWVVDFNAFFDTGIPVPVNNKARKIDSILANGLEAIPGGSGIMAILATRNLRRSLALGLPSGQGMASFFGIAPLTAAQLTMGLPANEVAVLNASAQTLLKKTPLWYYVLRESAVLHGGNQLGPVGAKIVADTFVRILKRDANSFLNVTGGFTPFLPSAVGGDFTIADLVNFAGVTQP